MQFKIGEFYTRKEVHQLVLGKPLPKTGTGNWLTGYVKAENDLIILLILDSQERLDMISQIILKMMPLLGMASPNSHSNQKQIKKLLHGELSPKIFIRHDNSDPKFKFLGNAEIDSFRDHVPIETPYKSCTAIEIKFNLLGTDKIEDELDSEIDFNGIFDLCMGRLWERISA